MVLTIAAAAYFQMASSNRASSLAVTGQQMAASRAEQAAQKAIADIRGNVIVLDALTGRATPSTLADCAFNCVIQGTFDGGATVDLNEGGGMLWNYMVYKNSAGTPPPNRYSVVATGYYGYTPTSPTFSEARVEVEIDVGSAGGANDLGPSSQDGFMGRR